MQQKTYRLKKWTFLASHFIGECYDMAMEYLHNESKYLEPMARFVSAQLFIDCHLTSESALILIENEKEWDADILSRSVVDGTVKFIFMLEGDEDENKNKAIEFWHKIPEISRIKRSDRLKKFMEWAEGKHTEGLDAFKENILLDEEEAEIKSKYSREEIRKLNEKWSFMSITKHFSESKNRLLKDIVQIAHGYAMSSHLIHKDGTGVGMVWERYGRNETEQNAVKVAHSARVVSDICAMAEMRMMFLLKTCGQKTDKLKNIETKYKELFDDLRKARDEFNEIEYSEKNIQ